MGSAGEQPATSLDNRSKRCELCRCGKDEFNPGAQLFFTPLVQAMRLMIHLGETVPDGAGDMAYHISAGEPHNDSAHQ